MSINIDSVLNNFKINVQKNSSYTKSSNTAIDSNIFAQASAIVAAAKEKQNSQSETNENKSKNIFGSLSVSQVANMSTKEFLNYAYDNQVSSGFNTNKEDSSGVKLPMLVRYKTAVVSTSGKSFMAVVAKLKAKFPRKSEEEIAAELLAKYGDNSSSGKNLNMSA